MIAAAVEPFALSALKYGLLALLFLFVWRAMRWVMRGLNVETGAAPVRRNGEAAPAARPTSLLIHADGRTNTYRLDGTTVLGRAPECDLRLDDTYVSQQHARIFDKDGNWYVEDLGSTNGTFVNEQRLAAPAMLVPGDTIRVGTTLVELRR